MLDRATCEAVFREAVAACDPAARVRAALARPDLRARTRDRAVLGIAIGKAAFAMARGAGEVARGIVVAPALDGQPLPLGWTARDAGHPTVDERSVAAGAAVADIVRAAGPDDVVLVLISGGASALVEQPCVPLAEFRTRVAEVMASGADIAALNRVRTQLSHLKGGGLARASAAPIITLAISDVIDDDLAVIGSGPTIPPRANDHAEVIAPMRTFADAALAALARRHIVATLLADPLRGDVDAVAHALAAERGTIVAWGEPTLRIPRPHGEGGRAQQLALLLAKLLRGHDRSAFVIGSDGIDGPPPAGRPAPAGAFVDGTTWDLLADPDAALARCDAGRALGDALVITGATGINHADLVVLG